MDARRHRAASSEIRALVGALKPRFHTAFDSASSGAELHGLVERLAEGAEATLSRWLHGEPGMAAPSAPIAEAIPWSAAPGREAPPAPSAEAQIGRQVIDGLSGIGQRELAQGLHLGRAMKLPLLKGRWSRTLEKWGGNAASVLQIALTLLQIGYAVHEENEKNRQARAAALARHQWVEEIASELQSALLDRCTGLIQR